MQPTDSLKSYNHFTSGHQVSTKALVRPGKPDLPEDVIEALNDDDLELALSLLEHHQMAGEDAEAIPNGAVSRLIKTLLAKMQFVQIASATRTTKKKKKGPSRLPSISQRAARAMSLFVKATAKLFFTSVSITQKIGQQLADVVAKSARQLTHRVKKMVAEPFLRFVVQPLAKWTGVLRGRIHLAENALKRNYAELKEKIREWRKATASAAKALIKEINELSRPIKLWLHNKFEKFVEQQKWASTEIGKQIVSVAEHSINAVSFALVPIAFSLKQISRIGQKAALKVRQSVNKGYSRFKGWAKGKFEKGLKAARSFLKVFLIAYERIFGLFLKRLLFWLKVLASFSVMCVKQLTSWTLTTLKWCWSILSILSAVLFRLSKNLKKSR